MSSTTIPEKGLPTPRRPQTAVWRGWEDFAIGLENWRLWHLMGIGALRRRYSRSRIGQFWTTLTTAIMIGAMGFTWSLLWNVKLSEILPSIAVGMVLWTFIVGVINDSTIVVTNAGNYFRNQNLAFSTPIFATIYTQLIILAHNAIIVFVVLAIYPAHIGWNVILFIPGMLLVIFILVCIACVNAILCSRYRDIIQLVANITQTAFYVTPVMFRPDYIPHEYRWLNLVNPFTVFLEITRSPLLGQHVNWENWAIALGIATVGALVALPMVGRYRKRIIYWI